MTKNDVIKNLLFTYGKCGITADVVTNAINDGMLNYDLSLEAVYNGLRMSLAQAFHEYENFTIEDVMSITGETREEVIARIDQMREEVEAAGENPDAYEVKSQQVQKFILPLGYLN